MKYPKLNYDSALRFRPGKSRIIKSMEGYDGLNRVDRKDLRRINKQLLRRDVYEFIPYRASLFFTNHPGW
jgi:hypothetical protein